jgi:uncharacterized protein (DUF488 family)
MPWWCSEGLACGPRPDTIVRTYDVPGERVMQSMTNPFFTVGHSTRGVDEFIHLLRQAEVELVVDVRSIPRSGTNPQFNRETFRKTLSAHQIGYEYIATLGGRRGKSREVPPTVNAFWEHQSFHNYADYAMTEAFRSGFAELRELGRTRHCAVMCAEAVWWRCHRRIIADYLIAAGEDVLHILGANRIDPARMTSTARPQPDRTLIYPVAHEN